MTLFIGSNSGWALILPEWPKLGPITSIFAGPFFNNIYILTRFILSRTIWCVVSCPSLSYPLKKKDWAKISRCTILSGVRLIYEVVE
jgi:hypothetical protein